MQFKPIDIHLLIISLILILVIFLLNRRINILMFNRKDKDIKIFNDYKHSIKIAALLSMFSLITLTIT